MIKIRTNLQLNKLSSSSFYQVLTVKAMPHSKQVAFCPHHRGSRSFAEVKDSYAQWAKILEQHTFSKDQKPFCGVVVLSESAWV